MAALTLSLALNLALAGWVVWNRHPSPLVPVQAAPLARQAPAVAKPAPAPDTSHKASADAGPAFAWSQLESDDFRVFISRLRAIGCPESTIHDIVKGELDEIYADKRQQLASQRGEASRRTISASLQREYDKLALEEDRLLAQLLGLAVPGTLAGDPSPPAASLVPALSPGPRTTAMDNMRKSHRIEQPLVLQEVDPAGLNLTPAQQQKIEELRQQFLTIVGAGGQNPDDPQYLARWREAQYYVDTVFRTAMGDDFINRYRGALVK